jgi:phage/plasmid-like protein (TIGR03299 family)
LNRHGLNYQIVTVPHVNHFTGQPTKFFDTYRSDNNEIMGAGLTDRYSVIQNAESFAAIEDISALYPGDLYFARGMTFDGGRVAVCQIDMGEMEIGEGRRGFKDKVKKYLTWTNSHDGSGAAHIFLSPVRIVCANTLTAALSRTATKKKGVQDVITKFSIRHTATAKERLEEARKTLRVIDGELKRTEITYQTMAKSVMPDDLIAEVLNDLFPLDGKDKQAAKNAKESQARAMDLIRNADDGRIDPRTPWAVYQGINHLLVHESPIRIQDERKSKDTARTQSVLTGTIAEKNAYALSRVLKVADLEDDIERILRQVETSQAAQLAVYAPAPVQTEAIDIFSIGMGG